MHDKLSIASAWCRWRLSAEMAEGPSGDLRESPAPVHSRKRERIGTGSEHTGLPEVDVVGAVVLGKKSLVTVGEAVGCLLCRAMLVPGLR